MFTDEQVEAAVRALSDPERFAGAERALGVLAPQLLDPYDANYFSLLSLVKLDRKKYPEALELADKALEIENIA